VPRIHLYKYQAAGNDFVLVDNRDARLTFSEDQITMLCDRRFGIGADGLIQLHKEPKHDFRMVYQNRDGSESFCGNGCRAIVHFAKELGIIQNEATFSAFDGEHTAQILADGFIRFSLRDVGAVEKRGEDFFVNTGTEHHVRFVKDLPNYPVFTEGKKIRYSDLYKPSGTNVDFVEINTDQSVSFRIYERGVEDETYSSGSGATACGLVVAHQYRYPSPVKLNSRGGPLTVEFKTSAAGGFHNIYLTGPAQLVFETEFDL
jgi:diaminopimelate epimerase